MSFLSLLAVSYSSSPLNPTAAYEINIVMMLNLTQINLQLRKCNFSEVYGYYMEEVRLKFRFCNHAPSGWNNWMYRDKQNAFTRTLKKKKWNPLNLLNETKHPSTLFWESRRILGKIFGVLCAVYPLWYKRRRCQRPLHPSWASFILVPGR